MWLAADRLSGGGGMLGGWQGRSQMEGTYSMTTTIIVVHHRLLLWSIVFCLGVWCGWELAVGFHQLKRNWRVADLLAALTPLQLHSHHCSLPLWLLLQTAFTVATFVTRPEGTVDVPCRHCNVGW